WSSMQIVPICARSCAMPGTPPATEARSAAASAVRAPWRVLPLLRAARRPRARRERPSRPAARRSTPPAAIGRAACPRCIPAAAREGSSTLDKRAAIVLGVIFGGLFLVLFGFMLLAYSALKSTSTGISLETETTAGARIGIVEAKGTIGEAAPAGIDSDKVVKLLKKYERDEDIKAVVLRVDSPGGAVAPSQEIHDAVKRIKASKKVVVSMGGMAASGGYYISAPADRIFAEPGTLTGSIGVIFLHFNVRGLLEWAKVEETTLKSGKYKDTLSPFRPIQESDREEIQSISDDVYSQFVQAVAQG